MRTTIELKKFTNHKIEYRILLGTQDIGEAWLCRNGYVSLLPEQCYICSVEIWEKFRGQGYSKELMTYIIELAKSLGYKSACLEVLPSNPVAVNLYRSFGFKIVYERKLRRNYAEQPLKMELML